MPQQRFTTPQDFPNMHKSVHSTACRLLWCVLCFLDAGRAGGGTGSGRVIQGWQSGSEWSTQALWENAPFQILFHDIASQKTTSPPPLPPSSLTQLAARTRHQFMQHLHISQQINSVVHTPPPCRELTNSLCGPLYITPVSFSHSLFPTRQYVQRQPAFYSSVTESCHSPPEVPQLDSSLVCHAVLRATQTYVYRRRTGSNLIRFSILRSTCSSPAHSRI